VGVDAAFVSFANGRSLCARQRLGVRQPSAALETLGAREKRQRAAAVQNLSDGFKRLLKSWGQAFAVGLVVAVPAAQGGVAGVREKKF
jgi:hypothetical protein